jgi:hypothetical protein
MKAAIAAALSVAAFAYAFPASADNDLKFKGGIGVIPVSSGVGLAPTATVVNRNLVRGVQPPGQIWVIEDLKADIDLDSGRIRVDGRGLLLGGGNTIGTNAGQSVRATLICDVAIPTGATTPPLFDTDPPVALEANGDFRIDDTLSPRPPAVCASPVLLIRNPGGAWFAAGILKR